MQWIQLLVMCSSSDRTYIVYYHACIGLNAFSWADQLVSFRFKSNNLTNSKQIFSLEKLISKSDKHVYELIASFSMKLSIQNKLKNLFCTFLETYKLKQYTCMIRFCVLFQTIHTLIPLFKQPMELYAWSASEYPIFPLQQNTCMINIDYFRCSELPC